MRTINKITVEIEIGNRAHRLASNDDTTHGSERGGGGWKRRRHRETAAIREVDKIRLSVR